jgi:hypothetical protein
MITFTLAFLALLFMPSLGSNALLSKLFYTSAILCVLYRNAYKVKTSSVQWLFGVLLAWMFLSSSICDNNMIASTGYWNRMEGFITWFILAVLAWAYWTVAEGNNEFELFKLPWNLTGFSQLFLLVLLSFITIIILDIFVWPIQSYGFSLNIMPNNALAGFASIAFILLYAYHPVASLPAIMLVLSTSNRTAILVLFTGLICYYALTAYKKLLKTLAISCLIAFTIIPFTGVYNRIAHLSGNNFGIGARSQWVLQGSELTKSVPVTGYGLDTLSRYLKPVKGAYQHKGAIVDRTHFLPIDMILQLGWIGYYIVLAILGCAVHIVLQNRTKQNVICLSLIVSWIVFNCFNPCGIYGHLMMLIGLMGIRSQDQKNNETN